ncbi:MAG: amidohydrolase family protein, partial [Acidobacteriota bacterium]
MTPSPAPSSPILLRGGTVLTLDARATVLRSTDILVEGGRIRQIGTARDLPPGTRVLDVSGHLVLPGLIQGHIHLGQTFFRGLAEGRRLLAWLRERIWPLEAAHDDESAYWCSLLGAAECLLGGSTTLQDIGIGPGHRGLLRALADSGLRAFAGPCLMDSGDGLPDGLRQETDRGLADAESLGSAFEGSGDGRLRFALNPRFILSCSDPLW